MPKKYDASYFESKQNSDTEESGSEDESTEIYKRSQSICLRGRRGTVMATPFEVSKDWKPPIYPKNEGESAAIMEAISSIFLFAALDSSGLSTVVNAMQRVMFQPNEDIIEQHDEGDKFYIVEDGLCVVYVDGELMGEIEGKTETNYFGELALLYDSPRAATIQASTVVSAWSLDRLTFKKIAMNTTIKQRNLYRSFLNEVPILSTLSKYQRLQLADALSPVHYRPNEEIISEGIEGDDFYIIEDGEVKCTINGEECSNRLGCGDYFGELALLTNERRKATVTTTRDTKCLFVDRSTFKRLLGPLQAMLQNNSELYSAYVQ